MLGFTPFKKHANKFNYTPRYYDPEAERRAQRRAELRGERPEDAGRAYEPGQYVRTARTARAARREAERSARSKRRFGLLLTGVAVLLLFFMVIYPRVTALMRQARQAPVPAAAGGAAPAHPSAPAGPTPPHGAPMASDLDQSGITDIEWQQMPVTVVPNDYQGE